MTINCKTTGKKNPFKYDLDNDAITITSESGTQFKYNASALADLYHWLAIEKQGDWVLLGARGEEQEPLEGSVEWWARSQMNPIGGFYGLTKGLRGRFASYIPAILVQMKFAETQKLEKTNTKGVSPMKIRALRGFD